MRLLKNRVQKTRTRMLVSDRTVGIAVEDVAAGHMVKIIGTRVTGDSAKPAQRLDSNRGLLVTTSGLSNIAVTRFAGTR